MYKPNFKLVKICFLLLIIIGLYGGWGMLMNYLFYNTVKYRFINNTNFSIWFFAFINNIFAYVIILPVITIQIYMNRYKISNKYIKYICSFLCISVLYFPLFLLETFMHYSFYNSYNLFTLNFIIIFIIVLCKLAPMLAITAYMLIQYQYKKYINLDRPSLEYENVELVDINSELYPIIEI